MQSDSQVHIHRKDAAEIVLSSCTEYHYVDGSCKTMDESMGKYFKGAISKTAARCVALAYRSHEIENVPKDEDDESLSLSPLLLFPRECFFSILVGQELEKP